MIVSDSEESSTDSLSSTSSAANNKITGERGRGSSVAQYGLNPGIIASGLCGCTAMLAKETGITVMGINILYDLYIHMSAVKR